MTQTQILGFMQGYIRKEATGDATAALIRDMAPGIHMTDGQPQSMYFKRNGFLKDQAELPGMQFSPGKFNSLKGNMAKVAKQDKVKKVMGEFKDKTLHSGSKKGPIVKNRKQAIAIALSEADLDKKASVEYDDSVYTHKGDNQMSPAARAFFTGYMHKTAVGTDSPAFPRDDPRDAEKLKQVNARKKKKAETEKRTLVGDVDTVDTTAFEAQRKQEQSQARPTDIAKPEQASGGVGPTIEAARVADAEAAAAQADIRAAAGSKYTPGLVPDWSAPVKDEVKDEGTDMMSVLSKYAPYAAGGAAIGGAGSLLHDKLRGAAPNVRKAIILATLTGGLGAAARYAQG